MRDLKIALPTLLFALTARLNGSGGIVLSGFLCN
jgi:hypothetical protein